MDCLVPEVTKSWTQLSETHFTSFHNIGWSTKIYLAASGLSCGLLDLCCLMQDLSLQHMDSLVVACGLSCSVICGILVSWPGVKLALQGGFLTTRPPGKPPRWSTLKTLQDSYCVCVCLVVKSCLTLCDPVDCSPPGPSVHGILQARIRDWVATSFFKGSSWPRDWTQVSLISFLTDGFFNIEPIQNSLAIPAHYLSTLSYS